MKMRRWTGLCLVAALGVARPMFAGGGDAPPNPPVAEEAVAPASTAPAVVADDHPFAAADFRTTHGKGDWLFGTFDYLNWKPRRQGLDFAIVDPHGGFPTEGAIKNLDLPRSSGYRGLIGLRASSGWDVGVQYTYFHTHGGQGVAAPTNGNLWAERVAGPDGPSVAKTALANGNINYNVIDIIAGRWFDVGDSLSLRFSGGPRLAKIDQAFTTTYNGFDFGVDLNVQSPNRFIGAGLAFAGEADWNLCWGLSLFGRLGGGVLVGRSRTTLFESDQFGNPNINVTNNVNQTVPLLETSVGVSWSHGPFQIAAGWELVNYFSLIHRISFVDDINPAMFAISSSDLGLSGFFIRGGVSY